MTKSTKLVIISDNPIFIGIIEMKYLTLIQKIQNSKYYIFSLRDLLILFPQENKKTLQNQLCEWIKKKYIIRLKRDLYELIDKSKEIIIPDVYIANRLYQPSYVSLETALSIYNIIPEVAFAVTSLTTNVTRKFKNSYGQFYYFSCKPSAFTGYQIQEYAGFKTAIADKEKAIVDFLYFRFNGNKIPDFKEERFDKDIVEEIRWDKLFTYAKLYNLKVWKLSNFLKEFVGC
ncbi:MAG: hypothetical protein AB1755_02650 [Candidatus Omnitrophota bacterium]